MRNKKWIKKKKKNLPLSLIACLASKPYFTERKGRIQKIPGNKTDKLRNKTKTHLKLNAFESLDKTTQHPPRKHPWCPWLLPDSRLCSLCCRFGSSFFPIERASGKYFSLSLCPSTSPWVLLFPFLSLLSLSRKLTSTNNNKKKERRACKRVEKEGCVDWETSVHGGHMPLSLCINYYNFDNTLSLSLSNSHLFFLFFYDLIPLSKF